MRNADFKFQISYLRAGRRRGVSILEVLFAILVTTIGLLGAIAVLPVASAMARKGRLNDAMAVAGISAVHQFDVQYMRNPSTWLSYSSGSYSEVTLSSDTAYFIDPGFMSDTAKTPTKTGENHDQFSFPYYSTSALTNVSNSPSSSARRMTRVSLKAYPTTTSTTAMPALQAESVFVIGDDLAYDRPTDRSLNAVQMMIKDTSSPPLKRQTEGALMWAATLAPKINAGTGSDLYILSILVFHRRDVSFPLDTILVDDRNERAINPERLVDVVDFQGGDGIGGGEVLLKARPGRDTSGDLDVRANDWIMLSGARTTTANAVGPVFLWYRVADTDPELRGTDERFVTLQGPDWPLANAIGSTSLTQATIVSGVVAVYEKTIRLDTGS